MTAGTFPSIGICGDTKIIDYISLTRTNCISIFSDSFSIPCPMCIIHYFQMSFIMTINTSFCNFHWRYKFHLKLLKFTVINWRLVFFFAIVYNLNIIRFFIIFFYCFCNTKNDKPGQYNNYRIP